MYTPSKRNLPMGYSKKLHLTSSKLCLWSKHGKMGLGWRGHTPCLGDRPVSLSVHWSADWRTVHDHLIDAEKTAMEIPLITCSLPVQPKRQHHENGEIFLLKSRTFHYLALFWRYKTMRLENLKLHINLKRRRWNFDSVTIQETSEFSRPWESPSLVGKTNNYFSLKKTLWLLQNCAPETCVIALTSVTPVNTIKPKKL